MLIHQVVRNKYGITNILLSKNHHGYGNCYVEGGRRGRAGGGLGEGGLTMQDKVDGNEVEHPKIPPTQC